MGLDEFTSDDGLSDRDIPGKDVDTTSTSGSSGSSKPKRKPCKASDWFAKEDVSPTRSRWVNKLDFSLSYVIVAADEANRVYASKDDLHLLRSRDDWKRLEDHPDRDYEILFHMSREGWLTFKSLCMDQLDEDPDEVFEQEPQRLEELYNLVRYPDKNKPDKTRTCRLCGAFSNEEHVTMLQIDLQKHRKVPVCASHTVEELAEEGLLL